MITFFLYSKMQETRKAQLWGQISHLGALLEGQCEGVICLFTNRYHSNRMSVFGPLSYRAFSQICQNIPPKISIVYSASLISKYSLQRISSIVHCLSASILNTCLLSRHTHRSSLYYRFFQSESAIPQIQCNMI